MSHHDLNSNGWVVTKKTGTRLPYQSQRQRTSEMIRNKPAYGSSHCFKQINTVPTKVKQKLYRFDLGHSMTRPSESIEVPSHYAMIEKRYRVLSHRSRQGNFLSALFSHPSKKNNVLWVLMDHVLWVLKRTAILRRFFRVPTAYVLMRNMKNDCQ